MSADKIALSADKKALSAADLSLIASFASLYPDEAARTLERHDPRASAEFFSKHFAAVPPDLISRLVPTYVSKMASHMKAARVGEILGSTDASFIAAVLRTLPVSQRNSILGYLPAPRRAACQLLLNFAEDSVGGWMNPNAVSLPIDSDIESARSLIKVADQEPDGDRLFVVSRDRLLAGYISHAELTRSKRKDSLRSLLHRDDRALLSRMTIAAAGQHPSWAEADIMPVVNRNQHFVGVIRHVDLRVASDRLSQSMQKKSDDSAVTNLVEAYGSTYLALFNSVEEIIKDQNRQKGN